MPKVPDDLTRAVDCPFRSLLSPRVSVSVDCSDGGLTKQSFRDECDINVIMGRYAATGVLPVVSVQDGRFEDVPDIDYQTAMFEVATARSMFNGLPARVRERFRHDPAELLAFLSDDKNVEEARELGLVKPAVSSVSVAVSGSASGAAAAQQSAPIPPEKGGSGTGST